MPVIKLIIEFDGTDFHGWQFQPNVRTVQAELLRAVRKMVGDEAKLRSSSRTDAGVHARGMPVTFETNREIPAHGYVLGLNSILPTDVSVRSAEIMSDGFHPRDNAQGKTYRYQIWNTRSRSALHHRYSWYFTPPLNVDAMDEAAQAFVGHHDYSAFRASHCDSKSVLRDVDLVRVYRGEESMVIVDVRANAFLRNMVRIMVGTLVEVGIGRFPVDSIPRILEGRNRENAGRTAPGHGLFLMEVHYG